MKYVLDFAKELLRDVLHEDSAAADFTMGNGHDTLFLAQLLPKGRVYAFDIQEKALRATVKLLQEHDARRRTVLIWDSHSNLDRYIKEELDAGIFNLGYLPGADKTVTSLPQSTLCALQKALVLLREGGVIVLVVYPGHPNGKRESDALLEFVSELDAKRYDVLRYSFLNKKDPPYLLAIQKRVTHTAL
ncbi:tRNA (mnm(5)s(2)U34)-methyltransferase [Candidatus Soleaferrea massiliensis]|uniref:tRNA (mnm(5)s(2)U34)-methyltransferase n=1 Tax=Candidatus Soleaferrea massiliensis TaxID=1470354 RepID=UPI00058CEE8C|nr:class I SAM-dependent methyltransferase [Candidatus Soleaferrea massiliensis]